MIRGTETFCFCYIDDIIVFSKNEREDKHLHHIANRLNHYSFKVTNLHKCLLGVSILIASRYTLSANGLTPSKDQIRAIQQLPEPTII